MTLNPGSPEAVKQGCKCPVMDNHYGKGILYNGRIEFWISEECPLHGKKGSDEDSTEEET